MKHYGEYEREGAILLGYNVQQGRVLVLRLADTTEAEQTWLANYLAINQDTLMLAGPMNTTQYNGNTAFGVFGARASQIPLHFVKIADRAQAEAWTGAAAQFSSNIVSHPFLSKLQNALGISPALASAAPQVHQPVPQVSEQYTAPATALGYVAPAPTAGAVATSQLSDEALTHRVAGLENSLSSIMGQLSSLQGLILKGAQAAPAPERKKPGRKPKVQATA